jgi:diamine N-acetyltransferase
MYKKKLGLYWKIGITRCINREGGLLMGFKIREAVQGDYEKLKPLHKEVHDLHVSGRPDKYSPTEDTLDKSYFNELLTLPDARIYIIEDDDKIAAFTILKKIWPPKRNTKVQVPVVLMEDLGVAASYRRKGLARKLFDQAVEFTKECNAVSLELGVWEFNRSAIEFYESMGMIAQARKMEMKVK